MGKFANVLIVTDLDGTLLDSQKKIGVASREAIRYFISQGGSFTFATGRLYQSFLGIRKRVIYNAPIVFANGAQIINMGDANILYQLPLESDMIPICEDVLSAFPEAALEVYAHKRCGVVRFNDISLKHMLDFSIEHTLYQTVRDVPQPWLKVLFTERTEVLSEIASYIQDRYQKASVCFSSKNFLEVFHADADKGRGTLKLAEILGINPEHIYTSGDQENDMALLQAAKLSFAPENAVDAIKERADIILPDNDSDMMAALISHLDAIY